MSPTISIVIPAYNAKKYLAKTLDSVLAQTRTDWECIVVDDGSKDDTAAVASRYTADPRIRLVQQQNAGVSAARNYGYEVASTESPYVIFLDADDIWEPETLQLLAASLDAAPELSAVYGSGCTINEKGESIKLGQVANWTRTRQYLDGDNIKVAPIDSPTTFEMLAFAPCIITPGVALIRRRALDEVGTFDTTLSIVEDYDLWLRLARHSPLKLIEREVIRYRQHSSNSSSNRAVAVENKQKLWRKTAYASENTPEQHRLVLRAYKAFYLYQAKWRWPGFRENLARRRFRAAARLGALMLANCYMAVRGCPGPERSR